ncbi:MAG: phage tail tape measure protein [Phycisphaerae bacterium]|nr:phage tail tape measure protein [Phycisphaerae bacterium]
MPDEIKIRVTADGTEQAQQKLRGVAGAEEQIGTQADKAKEKTGGLGAMLRNAGGAAVAFVAGFVGIQAIVGVIGALVSHLERVQAALKEIAREGLTALETVLPFAKQLGDTSLAGQQRALRIATQIQERGALPDLQTAVSLGISGDISLGLRKGNPKLRENLEKLHAFAPLVGAGAIPEAEAGKFLQIISASGRDMWEAALIIQRGAEMSKAETVGEFVGQMLRGGTSMLSQGVDLETTVAYAVAARQEAAEGGLAATSMKTFARLASGPTPESRKFLEAAAKERGQAFGSMTLDKRMQLLGGVLGGVTTPEQQDVVAAAFGGGQDIRDLFVMFSAGSRAAGAAAFAEVSNIDQTAAMADAAAFTKTPLAQSRQDAARRAFRRGMQGRFDAARLRQEAEEVYKEQLATGELGVFSGPPANEVAAIEAKLIQERIGEAIGRVGETPETAGQIDQLRDIGASIGGYRRPWSRRGLPDPTAETILAGRASEAGQIINNITNVHGNQFFGPAPAPERRGESLRE